MLYKRKPKNGPRTQWYFNWLNLQNYIWIPILYITNKLIYLINNQVRDKTIALLTKHKLGNMVCIKAKTRDSREFFWTLSNLQDAQCNIFPSELNWQHKLLDIPIQRIRFLFDQGLYYESIIVAQSVCESIVNQMFLDGIRLSWEDRYKYLYSYFKDILQDSSHLLSLLSGGLHEIYKYRNAFAHDYFEHEPAYIFNFKDYNKIEKLLEPFIVLYENMGFLNDVDSMYSHRQKFLEFYLAKENKDLEYYI